MNITYQRIKEEDIPSIIPFYIDYFNNYEDSCWTSQRVEERLKQLILRYACYGLIMKKDQQIIGFIVGDFCEFDDISVFNLNEILIFYPYQNQGYGSLLLKKCEEDVKKLGASRIQLETSNDTRHNHFYNDMHNYNNVSNNIGKTKALD